jgi:hypothetical protein
MQITSLLLHWMPACVLWTLRWYPTRSVKLDYDNRSDAAKASLSVHATGTHATSSSACSMSFCLLLSMGLVLLHAG